jgi:hypothetical protein
LTEPASSKVLNSFVLDLKYFDKGNIKCDKDGNNEMKKYGVCIKGWTEEKIRSYEGS